MIALCISGLIVAPVDLPPSNGRVRELMNPRAGSDQNRSFGTLATGDYVDAIFSASGSRLYAVSGNTVSVIDVANGAVLAQYSAGTKLDAIDVSADGHHLAIVEARPSDGKRQSID